MKHILIQPLITEKLNKLQEAGKYSFEVEITASKTDIKKAIEELYPDVKVKAVNTMIVATKPKGRFTKSGYIKGRTNKWKKALITLNDGQVIDFYSEV